MSLSKFLVCALLAASLPLCPTTLPAQGAGDKVLTKQERARIKFAELHERMQRLQVKLKETKPDESRVLAVGNEYVQEAEIVKDMETVRGLLADERWDEALEQMGEVRTELGNLMDLLLNRDLDLKRLLEQIKRLEAFKKRVEKLIGDQQAEKEAAARAEALQKQLADIEKAKARLENLIAEQKELEADAKQEGLAAAPNRAAKMAGKEGELKAEAKDLAKDLAELEKKSAELSKPKAAKPKAGKPKAGKPGAGSGSCSGASKSMGKAQMKLGQNKPESSLEDMNKALDQLEAAKKGLADLAEKARRQLMELPFEQQFRKQEETRIDTDTLAEDMEKAGEKGEGKKATPGKKNVQQAVPKQKAAAGMLKERRPKKAKQKQQDAKDDLQDAKKALEDALAQLRQQLQDEVLRSLEERFGAMLAKQKELTARTKVTDRLRAESLTADGGLSSALRKRCAELADGELQLASEAADGLKLLEEEGTTAVFPEMVGELREELEDVGAMLIDNKTGERTQADQKEIEETLKLLINALRRAIDDGEGGQCSSCNGVPQLVPLSAELKLIQALQKRVAKRTRRYDQQVPQQLRVTEEAHGEATKLSKKQGRIEELTRLLADKINKLDGVEKR